MIYGATTAQPRVTPFSPIDLGALGDIPVLGRCFFDRTFWPMSASRGGRDVITCARRASASTSGGRRDPEAAGDAGAQRRRIRYVCIALSGAFAALRRGAVAVATGVYLDNMTAGRGYIALAILILGRRHAVGVALAALLFGAADALQLRAQLLHISLPLQFS